MRRNRIPKKCEYCHKTVEIPQYRLKQFRFCSRKCHGQAVLGIPEVQKKIKRKFGIENYQWKGGRKKHSNGYIYILIGRKYILEHRYVMRLYLGRELLHREQVHHLNGDKLDNRIENLELLDISEHTKKHWELKRL